MLAKDQQYSHLSTVTNRTKLALCWCSVDSRLINRMGTRLCRYYYYYYYYYYYLFFFTCIL